MKLLASLILTVLLIPTQPPPARAEENDACKPVFEACAARGFIKDESAPAGKKIWLNCAELILNQGKAVEKVDVDPNGFDAKNCRAYRKAKEKFDADWAREHKRPAR